MVKESKMKRVEKHLYKAQYQTGDGNWSTRYYGLFRDWKKKQRCFPLGDTLQGARDKLGVLHQRNHAEYDFDKEREERAKAAVPVMTLEKWVPQFLNLIRSNRSAGRDAQHCAHLTGLLGKEPLEAIGGNTILEYKNKRLAECIVRYGKPVEGKLVKISTVNREIRCLVHALKLAEEAKPPLIDKAPTVRLDSEDHLARTRVLTEDEYKTLLEASPRWLQRAIIGSFETALTRGDLLRLTWDSIKKTRTTDGIEGEVITIKGGRQKTKAKQMVAVMPELAVVLEELREEQRRIANMDGRVFTKDGRPIADTALRSAFNRAVAAAKIEDFHWHDFRHCAQTRWARQGLGYEAAMIASGHIIPGMHGRYVNFSEWDILEAFQKILKLFKNENELFANVVSK